MVRLGSNPQYLPDPYDSETTTLVVHSPFNTHREFYRFHHLVGRYLQGQGQTWMVGDTPLYTYREYYNSCNSGVGEVDKLFLYFMGTEKTRSLFFVVPDKYFDLKFLINCNPIAIQVTQN